MFDEFDFLLRNTSSYCEVNEEEYYAKGGAIVGNLTSDRTER